MNLPRLTARGLLIQLDRELSRLLCTQACSSGRHAEPNKPWRYYQNSCINCQIVPGEDYYLFCECYDESGNLHPTWIAPLHCGNSIANCNGTLCC